MFEGKATPARFTVTLELLLGPGSLRDNWTSALSNLGSGSWLARADDAASNRTRQRTIGPVLCS